jgi:hypothetical protein
MYKSPIEVITEEMHIYYDDEIIRAVQKHDINVDKEELLKALKYDREQYEKGFKCGVMAFAVYLKEHSFMCDPGNGFSFDAIDVDELDDYVKEFLEVGFVGGMSDETKRPY